LRGTKVFVVDDEIIILMSLQSMLEELECQISGTATSLDEGVRLAGTVEADVAIVDFSLAGKKALPVIEILARRNIPVVASSGYDLAGMDGVKVRGKLQKPYTLMQLEAAVKAALDGQSAAAGG
jgi:DNA-binding NarL/FixJ family response regulator